MKDRKTISLDTFRLMLRAQCVPTVHMAFKCAKCGKVQSAFDLIKAGAGKNFEEVEKYLGFSCVGRFHERNLYTSSLGNDNSLGCNWTLGGLFQIHTLEVEYEVDGEKLTTPRFELATPEEAKAHMLENDPEAGNATPPQPQ